MNKGKIADVYGNCVVCNNKCAYDKESIKGDTYTLNGYKVIVCGNCVDDFLKTLFRRRDWRVRLGWRDAKKPRGVE